jgi:hypothetical protein
MVLFLRERPVRATRIFYLLLLALVACGGVTRVDEPSAGSRPASSAGAGGALDDQTEIVDDVDHTGAAQPAGPPGSSAFFWRGGLGNWFVSFSDGPYRDASVDAVVPPRGESQKAYHVTETTRGTAVDLWAQLQHPQGAGVDLSSYTAVSFWARLYSPGAELTVAFGANGQFSRVDSEAPVAHKVVSLSEDWTEFVVRFDEVRLDPTSVSSIDFVVGGRDGSFDLWVDDLAFLCKGTCPQ